VEICIGNKDVRNGSYGQLKKMREIEERFLVVGNV
jgi:hypothetical protein